MFVLLSLLQEIAEPGWVEKLIVAVAALLAIPVANSFVTGLIRKITGIAGGSAKNLAYIVALVMAAAVLSTNQPDWPVFNPEEPAQFVTACLLLAQAWFGYAETLYQRVLKAWGVFNPA